MGQDIFDTLKKALAEVTALKAVLAKAEEARKDAEKSYNEAVEAVRLAHQAVHDVVSESGAVTTPRSL